jgi:hypothetical protein
MGEAFGGGGGGGKFCFSKHVVAGMKTSQVADTCGNLRSSGRYSPLFTLFVVGGNSPPKEIRFMWHLSICN